MQITVVYCPAARRATELHLTLPEGSAVADAVRESRCLQGMDDTAIDALTAAIGGRKATATHVLRDGDRVELLRPLKVDPKVARRERFARQGAGRTGLFARRRDGAKAGY